MDTSTREKEIEERLKKQNDSKLPRNVDRYSQLINDYMKSMIRTPLYLTVINYITCCLIKLGEVRMKIGVKPEVQRVERCHMIRVIVAVMKSKFLSIDNITIKMTHTTASRHCYFVYYSLYSDHFLFQGKKARYKKAYFLRHIWIGQTS